MAGPCKIIESIEYSEYGGSTALGPRFLTKAALGQLWWSVKVTQEMKGSPGLPEKLRNRLQIGGKERKEREGGG